MARAIYLALLHKISSIALKKKTGIRRLRRESYSIEALEPRRLLSAIPASGAAPGTDRAEAQQAVAQILPPSGLTAIGVHSSEIDLTWTNADNSAQTDIWRSTDGLNYSDYTTTAAGANSFHDTSLVENTLYYYEVRSLLAGADSAFSAPAGAATLPLPPTNLIAMPDLNLASGGTSAIDLSWFSGSSAQQWNVEREVTGSGNYIVIASDVGSSYTGQDEYTDSGISPLVTYTYRLFTVGDDLSLPSNTATATAPIVPPLSFAAQSTSTSTLTLSWTNPPEPITAIEILRSTDGGDTFAPLASVPSTPTTFTDTGLREGSNLEYEVATVDGTIFSATTAPLSTYVLPNAPSNLTATAESGTNAIDLSWTNNSQNATEFAITRTVGADDESPFTATVSAPATTYVNTQVEPGQIYSYNVVAYVANSTATSAISNVVTITTPQAGQTSLFVTPVSPTEIDLQWNNQLSDATGIKIYDSTDGQNYTLITPTPLPPNATTYAATNLIPLQTYYFEVASVGSPSVPIPWFAENSASTPAPVPVLLSATLQGDNVQLSWSTVAIPGYSVTYQIYRDGYYYYYYYYNYPIATTSSTSYVDLSVPVGTHQYWVQAEYGYASTPYSNIVGITVPSSFPGTVNTNFGRPQAPYGATRYLSATAAFPASESDGSIFVAGPAVSPNAAGDELYRFTGTGALDPAFRTTAASAGFSNIVAAADDRSDLVFAGSLNGSGAVAFENDDGSAVASFGNNGIVSVPFAISAMAVQPDGNIVLWGSQFQQLEMVRLLRNGQFDPTFGADGLATFTIPTLGNGANANDVALLGDGDIVASCTEFDPSVANQRAAVIRIRSNGQLDSTFGSAGAALLPTIPIQGALVSDNVTFLEDGSFVAIYDGSNGSPAFSPVTVYRYDGNGSRDSRFGTKGSVTLPDAPHGGGYQALVEPDGDIVLVGGDGTTTWLTLLQADGNVETRRRADGRIVTDGTVRGLAGNPVSAFMRADGTIVVLTDNSVGSALGSYDSALACYEPDGQLDPAFGYQGVNIDPFGLSGPMNSAAATNNGQVVATGSELAPALAGPNAAALVRYDPDGSVDLSFGSAGHVFVPIGRQASFAAVVVAPDGAIYAAASGEKTARGAPVYAIYSFTRRGKPNDAFGMAGRMVSKTAVDALALLPDGDLVTASPLDSGKSHAVVVSRYTPRGLPDARFGKKGRTRISGLSGITGLVLDPDGTLLLGTSSGIVKLTASGAIDKSFGDGGFAQFAGTSALALAPNGDIVAISDSTLSVSRFLPNGTADTSFASGGVLQLNAQDTLLQSLQSVAVESTGEIVVGVSDAVPGLPPLLVFGIEGIDPTGTLDPNFGLQASQGTLLQTTANAAVSFLTVQPGNNILAIAAAPQSTGELDTPSGLFQLSGNS